VKIFFITFLVSLTIALSSCAQLKPFQKGRGTLVTSKVQKENLTVQDGKTKLLGELFIPMKAGTREKIKKPLPVVVVIHEWWGRNDYALGRAKKISQELEFATLAVDLYGNAKVVNDPTSAQALATPFYKNPQLGLKRMDLFIKKIKADKRFDAKKIVVIGYCFGGTQALNIARARQDINLVVSFHGGLGSSYKSSFKKLNSKIVVYHGKADPMVPQKEVDAFMREMKKLRTKVDFHAYEGATHAFTNPKATEIGKKYKIPVAYHKKADEDSWRHFSTVLSSLR